MAMIGWSADVSISSNTPVVTSPQPIKYNHITMLCNIDNQPSYVIKDEKWRGFNTELCRIKLCEPFDYIRLSMI